MKKFVMTGVAVGFAAVLSAVSALADITVATVGPITGQLAAMGEQYSQGAKKAVEDINKAGGVNGEKLVLEIGDDACDPKQAVNVANQLASKGVKFVAGHLCSGSSIPASKVYEEEGILQITPASTNPKFTDEGGWNVARVCGRDDAQGTVRRRLPRQGLRRQEGRHRRRQVGLRQGPRRRDPQGDERRRPHGSAERVDQRRREGLFRSRLQAQGCRRRSRLLRRLSPGSRPHPEADGRTGPQRQDDVRRLDEQRRALDHRRQGRREP